ncbi:MAG: hypothetical protein O7A06_12615 [Acidobacteria bacterium]|nr:hypothetical protein [Acidobacteriota bacterium]
MAGKQKPKEENLFEELIKLRDMHRKRVENGVVVVKGKDRPLEKNRLGLMRWYLHPSLTNTVIRTLITFVQEIPPGSRTGRLHFQGGQVLYIWEGKGHTILDGVRYDWKQGDAMNLPLRRDGVTVQHFNDDPDQPDPLVASEVNLVDQFGVDRGTRFEVLEEAP